MNSVNELNAFYTWFASAMIPSDVFFSVYKSFDDISAFHEAFMRKEKLAVSVIPKRYHNILTDNGNDKQLKKYHQILAENRIEVSVITDSLYPACLSQISDPPAVLFYQGDPTCFLHRSLSVIGSRSASYDGQKMTRRIARDLSSNGISIVSGFACGIDTSAHLGCIEGGSATVAVMGCGLDTIYPRENIRLRDRILEQSGILLSEFIPGEKPVGWHFPVRNRIITGISSALVLMEARIKSGSLTSVQHALNQGKDIFVYPGDPSSSYFEGNHQLLREGARFFTCANDILEDMSWLDNQPIVGQNIDCSVELSADSPAEKLILQALKPGARSFEQLSEQTGLSPSDLMCSITMLQVKGVIESLPGKFYRRIG